jgi:hypothetical protein
MAISRIWEVGTPRFSSSATNSDTISLSLPGVKKSSLTTLDQPRLRSVSLPLISRNVVPYLCPFRVEVSATPMRLT